MEKETFQFSLNSLVLGSFFLVVLLYQLLPLGARHILNHHLFALQSCSEILMGLDLISLLEICNHVMQI